jgi:hypothetical protein
MILEHFVFPFLAPFREVSTTKHSLTLKMGGSGRKISPSTRRGALDQQAFPEAIAVIALVGEQRRGFDHRDFHQWFGGGVIRCLATGQEEAERASLIV